MPQVALAWVKDRPGVGSLVVGARDQQQLRDNLAAVAITLSPEQHDRRHEADERRDERAAHQGSPKGHPGIWTI